MAYIMAFHVAGGNSETNMVLILNGNSERVTRVWRKISFLKRKSDQKPKINVPCDLFLNYHPWESGCSVSQSVNQVSTCVTVYLMVFCRSWSTPPLGKRVFRYLRISELIEPETKENKVRKSVLHFRVDLKKSWYSSKVA